MRFKRLRTSRLNSDQGLTMVELVIAIFVFSVAGMGVYSSYLSSSQLIQDSTNHMRAVEDLGDIMEQIQATSFDDLLATFPAGIADGGASDYEALIGGYTLEDEQITVTYPAQTTGRVEVLVTLTWVSRNRAYTRSLSTVRTSG